MDRTKVIYGAGQGTSTNTDEDEDSGLGFGVKTAKPGQRVSSWQLNVGAMLTVCSHFTPLKRFVRSEHWALNLVRHVAGWETDLADDSILSGLKLLGFKDKEELRFEDNVKHSQFIYPDEMVRDLHRCLTALPNSLNCSPTREASVPSVPY